MSFRIDDILGKSDDKAKGANYRRHSIGADLIVSNANDGKSATSSSSILEETLLKHKTNALMRSISEPYDFNKDLHYLWSFWQKAVPLNYHQQHLPLHAPCYYHHALIPLAQNHSKRKGGQIRFTSKQIDVLEKRFHFNKYLSPEERKVLADSLKLSDRQVKTWFQNRRAKWRRNSNENHPKDQSEQEVCKNIHS